MSASRRLAGRVKRRVLAGYGRLNCAALHLIAGLRGRPSVVPTHAVAQSFGLSAGDCALVLAPHPDDETIGMGATICALLNAGVDVRILLLTDGAQSRAGRLNQADPQDRGRIRLEEFQQALAQLDDRITYCGPLTAEKAATGYLQSKHVTAQVNQIVKQYAPRALFAPPPNDYHPDHRSAALIAQGLGSKDHGDGNNAALFYYEIQAPHRLDPKLLVVESSTGAEAQKRAALACYQSQAGTVQICLRLARYRAILAGTPHLVETFADAQHLVNDPPPTKGLGHNPAKDLAVILRGVWRK